MTIDGSAILGLVGVILSGVAAAFVLLLRYTIALKDAETARRLGELERARDAAQARAEALSERTRLDELATERLRGQCENALQRILALERDQVPRAEWEQQVESIQSQLAEIVRRLDRSTGRYTSSDPSMPAAGRRNIP